MCVCRLESTVITMSTELLVQFVVNGDSVCSSFLSYISSSVHVMVILFCDHFKRN